METSEQVEQVEQTINKTKDWWGIHNIGTRVTLMTLLALTVVIVLVPMCIPNIEVVNNGLTTYVPRTIPHYEIIASTVIQATAWAFVIVTVGPNTVGKVAEAWMTFRGGKK